MKKEVVISSYSENLKGIFEINKNKYEINGVIPGEKVLVDIDKKTKLINVLNKSDKRVKVNCPIYDLCGGCTLQHIDYSEQLNIKTKWLENLFLKAFNKHFNIPLVLGMKEPFNYRNKNQMVLKKEKNKLIGGMYQEGTHNVIDHNNCLIQDEVINKVQEQIKKLIIDFKYSIYDEDKKVGLFRHVLVKRSLATKEILVVLITTSLDFPGKNNFVKAITKLNKEITSIVQNVNNRKSSAVLGDKEVVLYGPGFIFDILLGKKFKITSKSFYQINSLQTEVLYSEAIKLADLKKTDTVLDAYAGVGTIGLIVANNVKKVLSVEIVKDAVKNGIDNAKYNKINNVVFVNDDATKYINYLAANNQKLDVIIMDPPRSGSTVEFLNAVKRIKPRKIVYVSCNPVTQVEDLKQLLSMYNIKHIQGVDMFPHTSHVESVVCLTRK